MNEERLTELIDIYLGLLAERQLQRQIAGLVRPAEQHPGDETGDAEYRTPTQERRAIGAAPQPPAEQDPPKGGKTPRYKAGPKAIGSAGAQPQHPQQHPGNGPYHAGPYGGPQS